MERKLDETRWRSVSPGISGSLRVLTLLYIMASLFSHFLSLLEEKANTLFSVNPSVHQYVFISTVSRGEVDEFLYISTGSPLVMRGPMWKGLRLTPQIKLINCTNLVIKTKLEWKADTCEAAEKSREFTVTFTRHLMEEKGLKQEGIT